MTYIVKELDTASVGRWEEFVARCPEATFFHKAGWKRVVENSFRHRTHYLYAERDGVICGVLPLVHVNSRLFANGLISNAFCVAGGPAVMEPGARGALDRRAQELMEEVRADYVEYRDPPAQHESWAKRENFYVTFEKPILRDYDAALKDWPKRQRNVLLKGMTAGLTAEVETGIGSFHPLYALSMRNFGTPVFPRRYFQELLREFAGCADITTVRHQGKPIASVLSFWFRERALPYYIGTDPISRELGGSEFVIWEIMRRGAERGCTIMDLGRSKVGTGPAAFKHNIGCTSRPLVYEFKMRGTLPIPEVNPLNPKYQLMIRMWKRLPVPVANLIGPHIVRGIG